MGHAKLGLIGLLKKEMELDFWGTVTKVAEIGYKGIEAIPQLLEGDAAANVERFRSLGLEVVTHSATRDDLRDNLDKVIKDAHTLRAPHVTVWWAPCKDKTKEEWVSDAELYNTAGARLAAEGLKLLYHNHEYEFVTAFDGVYALDVLALNTDPKHLSFEIDIAWATYGGVDPAQLLSRLAGRVPAIHLKDFYALSERGQFTTVGTGVVDIAGAVAAANRIGVDWMVVEQDKVRNLTPLETVTASYLNLKEAGLLG